MDLQQLLRATIQHQASDLHLQVGSPATLRMHGVLRPLQTEPLMSEDMAGFLEQIATPAQREALQTKRALDFAYLLKDEARFRVAAYYERSNLTVVFRLIPTEPPMLEQLNLPPVIREIAMAERGLVLVTGTTGSGKSTTLAGMVDHINRTQPRRIITVEDPIEFVHKPIKSLVAQREVGQDATGFLPSLREAMRQDPDVILIGELRDQETMTTALMAADTGHLVFSTIHTTSAAQTIQRIIAMCPPNERQLMLIQLATNLTAVISQRLARTADGKGRLAVVEIMRGVPIVRKLLLEKSPDDLPQVIASREYGMQLFDQHLADLVRAETISGTEAMRLATNPEAVALARHGISTADLSGGILRKG